MLYGFSYPVVADVTYGGYRNGYRGHSSAHKNKTLLYLHLTGVYTYVYLYIRKRSLLA